MLTWLLYLLQGFDRYGVWRIDAVPAPNLKEALKLKAGSSLKRLCMIVWQQSSLSTICWATSSWQSEGPIVLVLYFYFP